MATAAGPLEPADRASPEVAVAASAMACATPAAADEAAIGPDTASSVDLAFVIPLPEVIKGLCGPTAGAWGVKPDDGVIEGAARFGPSAVAPVPA